MPACAPEGGDLRGVHLRTSGFGVVEVAPGEHAHAAQIRPRGDVAQLRDDIVGAATAHVGNSSPSQAGERGSLRAECRGDRAPARTVGPGRVTLLLAHEGDAVKLTGERPMQGATPDSLLALHDAGYREVVSRLGPGLVLDVGCGVGDETARLDGRDRVVVGVDYSAPDGTRRGGGVGTGRNARQGRAVRGDGRRAPRVAGRRRRLGVLVAHHRALHEPRAARRGARARARTGWHRVRDHAERAGRLREPLPRVPLRARAPAPRCSSSSSPTCRCSASKATTHCMPTSRPRRASGNRLLKLDVLHLRRRLPRRTRTCGPTSACSPSCTASSGARAPGSARASTRRTSSSRKRSIRPPPCLFAIARSPRPRAGEQPTGEQE